MATLEDVIFTGNTSTDDPGGGIAFSRSTLTIRRWLIAGNTAANDAGGGLYLIGGGTSVKLENVTVSGNPANPSFDCGGDIYHKGSSLTLRNVTIAGNSTPGGQGEGLYLVSSNMPLSMLNTILADNGDFSQTHTLLAGSLALDAGKRHPACWRINGGRRVPATPTTTGGSFAIWGRWSGAVARLKATGRPRQWRLSSPRWAKRRAWKGVPESNSWWFGSRRSIRMAVS